jgi:hypothetical protein
VTAEIAEAVEKLLSVEGPTMGSTISSAEVAAGSVKIWEKLSNHFARLIGDTGSRTLLNRCVSVSSTNFPCLADARAASTSTDASWDVLSGCLARQDPAYAVEVFTGLFATFVELLGRFIGDALVSRVLHEIWPEVFPLSIKETL